MYTDLITFYVGSTFKELKMRRKIVTLKQVKTIWITTVTNLYNYYFRFFFYIPNDIVLFKKKKLQTSFCSKCSRKYTGKIKMNTCVVFYVLRKNLKIQNKRSTVVMAGELFQRATLRKQFSQQLLLQGRLLKA